MDRAQLDELNRQSREWRERKSGQPVVLRSLPEHPDESPPVAKAAEQLDLL
jgi:hypothetical protein